MGDRRALVDPERVRAMMGHWYRYPPTAFEKMSEASWAVVALERLVAAPERMLVLLGRKLALDWLEDGNNRARALVAMHRNYGSRYGVPRTIDVVGNEAVHNHRDSSVPALSAAETTRVMRRFQTDLRRGIALALRVD